MSALLSLGVGPFSSDTLTQECWPGSPGSPPVVTSLDSLTPHLKNPHILKEKKDTRTHLLTNKRTEERKTNPHKWKLMVALNRGRCGPQETFGNVRGYSSLPEWCVHCRVGTTG